MANGIYQSKFNKIIFYGGMSLGIGAILMTVVAIVAVIASAI